MSAGIARGRLKEERKAWRRDHPYGFYARPISKGDGSSDIMKWEAGVPGKEGTDWEGGVFRVSMDFPEDYPSKPPKCTICLSILNEEEGWRPAITLKQVLIGIQDLLNDPNPDSPAQSEAYQLFMQNKAKYKQRVRQEAAKNRPST